MQHNTRARQLAASALPRAAKPYWWQYGQAAYTATHRVNVRMNRFSPTYQAHSSTYRHNKTHPTRSHYPLPKSQKDPGLVMNCAPKLGRV